MMMLIGFSTVILSQLSFTSFNFFSKTGAGNSLNDDTKCFEFTVCQKMLRTRAIRPRFIVFAISYFLDFITNVAFATDLVQRCFWRTLRRTCLANCKLRLETDLTSV